MSESRQDVKRHVPNLDSIEPLDCEEDMKGPLFTKDVKKEQWYINECKRYGVPL